MISIKTNDCIKDKSVPVEMFNNRYINIVEKTSGTAPESLGDSSFSSLPESDEETVNKSLKHYENHPSVSKIKCNQIETPLNFDFPTVIVEDINKITKSSNKRKATGPWYSSKDFKNCKKCH